MPEIDNIFYFFCHQSAERSAHFGANISPVCYRCAGIYSGIFSVYMSLLISKKFSPLPVSKKEIIFYSFLFLPLIIDGLGNKFALWESFPLVRSISGLLAGIALASVLIPLSNYKLNKKFHPAKKIITVYFISFFVGLFFLISQHFELSNIFFYFNSYIAASGLFMILINLFLICRDIGKSFIHEQVRL